MPGTFPHPPTSLKRLRLAVMLSMIAWLSGCSLIDDLEDAINDDDEIVHCASGRGTEIYFTDAIRYNESLDRWIFHNWKGNAADGGCDIHVNVHDDGIALSSTLRQAIATGATAWKNAITAAGVRCDVFVHFASDGDAGVGDSPRIDMEFVDIIAGGGIAGSTVVTANPTTRRFSHVRIQIAARIVEGSDTLAIPQSGFPALVTHEYGHALGILGFDGATGHSTEPEDVMFPATECAALSAGDIATMKEAYSRTPFYTPVSDGSQTAAAYVDFRVTCRH